MPTNSEETQGKTEVEPIGFTPPIKPPPPPPPIKTAKEPTRTEYAQQRRELEQQKGQTVHTIDWHMQQMQFQQAQAAKGTISVPTIQVDESEPVILDLAETIAASKYKTDTPTPEQIESVKQEALELGIAPETGQALPPGTVISKEPEITPDGEIIRIASAEIIPGQGAKIIDVPIKDYPQLANTDKKTRFASMQNMGIVDKDAILLPGGGQEISYLTGEQATGLKEQSPELYEIITKEGAEAYRKAITERQSEYEQKRQEFEAQLSTAPIELQEAYRTGGIAAFELELNEYNEAVSTAMKSTEQSQEAQRRALSELRPYIKAYGGEAYEVAGRYDINAYLEDNPTPEAVRTIVEAQFPSDIVETAQQYVISVREVTTQLNNALSLDTIRETGGIRGVDSLALERAIFQEGLPFASGSGAQTWRELPEEEKVQVAASYMSDPARRNVFADVVASMEMVKEEWLEKLENTASPKSASLLGKAGGLVGGFGTQALFFIPTAMGGLVDQQIEKFKNFDYADAEWQHFRKGEKISNEEYKELGDSIERDNYVISPETVEKMPIVGLPRELAVGLVETVKGGGKQVATGSLVEKGVGLATLAIMLLPLKGFVKPAIKGVVSRARPDTMTGVAKALESDVGRVEVPSGMSRMTARQLLEDVEAAQLTGRITLDRLNAYSDVTKGLPKNLVKYADIIRDPATGSTNIKLLSADGNIWGRVSGMQRISNDVIYHATGDTADIMRQIQNKGYFEVVAKEGQHPVMYFSPQVAQNFMFRNIGDSPGVVAIRIRPENFKQLPKEVLDSPTPEIMRQRMFAMAESGKLESGIYPLSKGYGSPFKLEYEVIAPPGTRFYPLEATWYAPNKVGAPMTRTSSMIKYDGSLGGKAVNVNDLLPEYWLGTKEAIGKGAGVPSVLDMYAAKILGDLTLVKQWVPWNLRLRPKPEGYELTGVSSPNPLYSAYRAIKLKARPEDTTAGRVSAVIFNEKGEILLTRNQGAKHFDLPGGGTLKTESINKAVVREVFEETGLKSSYIEHIDTFNSTFAKGGTPQKFQIFQVEAKGKSLFGREVAEHIWWDGTSKLKYPISSFTDLALQRLLQREALIDNLTVAKLISEARKRASEESFGKSVVETEKAFIDELTKVAAESDRAIVPYKSAINNKAALLEALVLADTPVYNDPPLEIARHITENQAIVGEGMVDPDNIRTVSISDIKPVGYEAEPTPIATIEAAPITAVEAEPVTEAKLVTEPIITTEAIEVTEPIEPIEPFELVEPFEPIEPIEPIEPVEPFEPIEPIEPIEPVEPFEPVEPIEPIEPVEPFEPVEPPPSKPKPFIKLKDKEGKEVERAIEVGTVVWVQGRPTGGAMYKMVFPPYDQDSFYTTRELPTGYEDMGWSGVGSVKESIQVLGGMPESNIENLDLGWSRINIDVSSGKPDIEFVQDYEANVGDRAKTVGQGDGQIPIESWEYAKRQGMDYRDFVNSYQGALVGDEPAGGNVLQVDHERNVYPYGDKYQLVEPEYVATGESAMRGQAQSIASEGINESDEDRKRRLLERAYSLEEELVPSGKAWYDSVDDYVRKKRPVKRTVDNGERYYRGHPIVTGELGGEL